MQESHFVSLFETIIYNVMDPTLKSERCILAFARSKRVPIIKQSLLKTPPVKVSRRNTIKMVRFSRKQSPPPRTAL